jgi:hypothetical protein
MHCSTLYSFQTIKVHLAWLLGLNCPSFILFLLIDVWCSSTKTPSYSRCWSDLNIQSIIDVIGVSIETDLHLTAEKLVMLHFCHPLCSEELISIDRCVCEIDSVVLFTNPQNDPHFDDTQKLNLESNVQVIISDKSQSVSMSLSLCTSSLDPGAGRGGGCDGPASIPSTIRHLMLWQLGWALAQANIFLYVV